MIRQESKTTHTSSLVWIILFSLLIILSVISNTVHLISSLLRRQFNLPHLLLAAFFLINLLDYALLVLELSVDHDGQYPYGEVACAAQQLLKHASPLLTASAIVLFSEVTLSDHQRSLWATRILSLLGLTVLLTLLLPSIFYSEIQIYENNTSFCLIDLSGVGNKMGLDIKTQHIVTALYFILYKSVLPFWLPLFLTAIPLVKMIKRIKFSDDKYFSQSLHLTILISFFVFNLPLAILELTRHISPHLQSWTLQVLNSLFILLTFFFHIFRPVACLVLRSENCPKTGYQQVDNPGEQSA